MKQITNKSAVYQTFNHFFHGYILNHYFQNQSQISKCNISGNNVKKVKMI